MASTSECSQQLEQLKLADSDCPTPISSDSESVYVTASAGGSEYGTAPCSSYLSAPSASGVGVTGMEGSSGRASVEEQIERSKSHWSLLMADESNGISDDDDDDDEVAAESNVRVFEALQRHRTWGEFFFTFGFPTRVYVSEGELKMGEKFAEGGQAELFHAQVTWRNPKLNERDVQYGAEWVAKVFKEGTFLRDLQRQLPHGLLQFHAEQVVDSNSPTAKVHPRYFCDVHKGILLEDGRFGFLMKKESFDLRTLIERSTRLRNGKEFGPFSKEEGELLMYDVALGVEFLHDRDIVHRDLKASNVLIHEFESGWPKWGCFVADYECSVGVVGTGFFRAPEILQACKERKVYQKPDVFSKAADIYSYGMICYEILTGKLPYEGHSINDYDVVLNGGHLVLPKYVEDWTRELLQGCWESNPRSRPTIEEVLDSLVANSSEVKTRDELNRELHGSNFRKWKHIEREK